MGAGFAYMTLRSGGIELSTGAHAANNILFILLVKPFGMGGVASSGIWLGDLGLLLGYVVVTEAIVRLPQIRVWADLELPETAPPPAATA
jgi:hypothetical protein